MDISLNGSWTFSVDENNTGKKNQWFSPSKIEDQYEKSEKIQVPSCISLKPGLNRYGGVVWYFLRLPEVPYRPKSHEYSFEFDGINYSAEIWLNGYNIGSHEGGFLPFRCDFSPKILSFSRDNYLAVRVDTQLHANGIPSNNIPWFNWSGIYRTVKLLILEKTRVKQIKIQSHIPNRAAENATVTVEYVLKNPQEFLDRCYAEQKEPQIEYELYYLGRIYGGTQQFNKVLIQTGIQDINPESLRPLERIAHDPKALSTFFSDVANSKESFEEPIDLETYFASREEFTDDSVIDSEKASETNEQNDHDAKEFLSKSHEDERLVNSFQIVVKNPALWSPENPELYELKLELHGVDQDKEIRFGIREIKQKKEHIYLNNHPITLKGIILHEENELSGRTISKEQRRKEVLHIKSLGFNAIRTAHYPHNYALFEIANEEGILIIEELPFYGKLNFSNKSTRLLAKKMIEALILRDFNHPSIVFWSLGNNLPTEKRQCHRILPQLIEYLRHLDPTRLVLSPTDRITKNPIQKWTECVGLNMPPKRQKATQSQINLLLNMTYYSSNRKPIIITEFGLPLTSPLSLKKANSKYFEEKSMSYILNQIQLFNSKPFIAGWFLACYRDFRIIDLKAKGNGSVDTCGLLDSNNKPKLIVKYLPYFLTTTLPSQPNHQIVGRLFGIFGIWIETYMRIFRLNPEKAVKKQNMTFYFPDRQPID